jgi:hypothetical protein
MTTLPSEPFEVSYGGPNSVSRKTLNSNPSKSVTACFWQLQPRGQGSQNNNAWSYFLKTYTPLDNHFDITLAELHLES